jgi:hypothetical protein
MIHLTDSFQQISRIDLAEQTDLFYCCPTYTTIEFILVRT